MAPATPVATTGDVFEVDVRDSPLRLRAGAPLSFTRTGGQWRAARFEPAGKRPGLEGPIVDAVRGRHIYVYGTLNATPEALEARKRVAETAAMWTGARGSLVNSACNDDDDISGTFQSRVDVPVTAGTPYYIEIAGYDASAEGSLVLHINKHPDAFSKTSPTNGATEVALNPTLSWGASSGRSW